ncbi:procollagen C-endopeptidase enhancer 2-like [Rhopilema esculentum]|uniref:procollagen C-endopeptidase enhancer 2-like n=1 Tax=Rhopilema esculentum TaxID=499914 RepID=UPI0031D38D29
MVVMRWFVHVVLLECFFVSFACSKTINFELQGEQGSFTSPNYPSTYPVNVTVLWVISAPQGTVIKLNFTEFKIETNKKCLYDYVFIANADGDRTKRYCGERLPPGYTSDNNKVLVTFVSDKTTANKGFRARWKAYPLKGGRTTPSFATPPPAKCYTQVTITMKEKGCKETLKTAVVTTGVSCSCSSPTETTVVKRVYATPSTSAPPNIGTTSYAATHVLGKKISNEISKNDSETSCSPGSQKYEKEFKGEKNEALVIWLGALVAAFFFTDVLLLFLWCRLNKRRSQSRNRPCQSEVSAVELKIVGGKVTSPSRSKPRRVKVCEKKRARKSPSHNRRLIDTNGNSSRDKGTSGILKGKHSILSQDHSRFVSSAHAQ